MKSLFLLLALIPSLTCAELFFETQRKEIHAGPDARQVVCDFPFENRSDQTVTIANYQSTCSCMSVKINNDGKRIYAPGEKGILRANFDMENFTGEVDKQVLLWLKGDPESKPSIRLVVHVVIPTLVDIQPRTLVWHGPGPWEAKTMKVTMKHSEPIRILQASLNNPSFAFSWKEVVPGKEYELTAQPLENQEMPPGVGVIHLQTDCRIDKQKRHMAFVNVLRDRNPSTSQPQLGPAPRMPSN
jgi:hypothetical protein